MNEDQKATAEICLKPSEGNTLAFPQIVESLMEAGFESYAVDFRQATATYFLPSGECIILEAPRVSVSVAPAFDTALIKAAIREAQQQVPGYTYKGFCEKAALAGCVSYHVSFVGRRALYIGRTAETHVEHFPKQ